MLYPQNVTLRLWDDVTSHLKVYKTISTLIPGQGVEGPLDLLTAAQEEKRRLGIPSCTNLSYV